MIPKLSRNPYSSIYVEELDCHVSYYEVVRAIYTKTPIRKVDIVGVREKIPYALYAKYVFGNDNTVDWHNKLRYVLQTYTLYALGATYEELCNNDTSRIMDILENIPYSKVDRVYTPGSYHEFTLLFTLDTCYIVPTWYYNEQVKENINDVYVVSNNDRYKQDNPIPYSCFHMTKWLREIPFEIAIPINKFLELDKKYKPTYAEYFDTPPVVMSAKCRRKDWRKLFFDIEILLPSYADRKYLEKHLKTYDSTALEVLNNTIAERGYDYKWFECSRKQYANGALFYTFAIKSAILNILKEEGFEE